MQANSLISQLHKIEFGVNVGIDAPHFEGANLAPVGKALNDALQGEWIKRRAFCLDKNGRLFGIEGC
ncbi:MAG TPA: hypothetical protein VKR06_12005 [Ktedonosporobacter sp.]|nr:hypothetical protein [Ktedonosporobacter sp.]